MKSTEKSGVRFLTQTAQGPFSYISWPKKLRFTVLRSHWVDGELVIIELGAAKYLANMERADALAEVENRIFRLSSISLQLSARELKAISIQLDSMLDGINLRYARNIDEIENKLKGPKE